MGLKLNTASSGSVSLEPANTASNFTLTVPAQTGTVVASDSSGNVGIGTASPSYKLQVSEASTTSGVELLNIATVGVQDANNYADISFRLGNLATRGAVVRAVANGNAAGNGHSIAFLTSPNGGVPTERARIDSSGNLLFNSGYGSVATAYGCRAWVNFNGTGTVAIRASGNVTSITDNGTGTYTINFTTAMPDTNYAVCATACSATASDPSRIVVVQGTVAGGPTNKTTSSVRVVAGDTGTDSLSDIADVNVSIFR